MSKSPFTEFPPVTASDWKKKITAELKGKPFTELVVRTKEGFDIQPFYTAEDAKTALSVPVKKAGWEIRQNLVVTDLKEASTSALEALASGADSIGFDVSAVTINKANLQKLLKGINLSKHPVHFTGVRMKSLETLASVFTSKTRGSVTFSDFSIEQLTAISKYVSKYPSFHFITLTGLESGTTLLHQCVQAKIRLKKILPSIRFLVTLSEDYFIEIAKLRAFRTAWVNNVNAVERVKEVPVFIHAENVIRATAKGDEHYNLLRATTVAMAAITGGCDSLSLNSGELPGKSQAFSDRIYRNIQLLLKHESYFDTISDAVSGSYFADTLTRKLCEQEA